MVQGRVREGMTANDIDGSVYPDLDSPPRSLETSEEKADYIHRVCAAWDHGVPPDAETVALFESWKDVFDRFPVVLSPAYHAMRIWFGWERVPLPTGLHPPELRYQRYDAAEGRPADPCEELL
jgi:hypothetical protein